MKNKEKTDISLLNKSVRILMISSGTLFLGIAAVGIFIPVLPTTPFVLLAATLYARSSRKFYFWLINNRVFGKHIRNYRDKKGISLPAKIIILLFLWITIGCSIIFAVEIIWVKVLLFIIAVAVTTHIIILKTLAK